MIVLSRSLLIPLAAGSLLVLASCGGDDGDASAAGTGGRGRAARDSADGGLAIVTRVKYAVAPLAQAGSLAGTVRASGPALGDTTWTVVNDAARCGATVTVPRAVGDSGVVGEAIVWLDDVTTGKPLPETRRLELTHQRCRYEPRVVLGAVPSTVNLLNTDRAVHTTHVTRVGAARPLVTIPFTDDGQVVPDERATRESGIVEVRCREHPWAVAHVAVFDHPYYAVTGADGRFTIDSVPAGTYTLKAWHPRAGAIVAQKVTVGAGAAASVEPVLGLK